MFEKIQLYCCYFCFHFVFFPNFFPLHIWRYFFSPFLFVLPSSSSFSSFVSIMKYTNRKVHTDIVTEKSTQILLLISRRLGLIRYYFLLLILLPLFLSLSSVFFFFFLFDKCYSYGFYSDYVDDTECKKSILMIIFMRKKHSKIFCKQNKLYPTKW